MTTSHSDSQGGIYPDFVAPRPAYEHVMIDIETMSLSKHNALILSIGMIEFDPTLISGPLIGARSLILPNIEQQIALGREISKSTQKWWQDQKPEARAHWVDPMAERLSLGRICSDIRTFCAGASRVWANGTQFDLSNLEELNRQQSGEADLWHYQAPRDMRTFARETVQTRLVPLGDALDIPGVPHEPVYDCIVQAHQVWSHWST